MKAWQIKNMEVWHEKDKMILAAEGFNVAELSPYHFRITSPVHTISVEVWPSKRKMMQTGASQTEYYSDDILNAVADIFEKGV